MSSTRPASSDGRHFAVRPAAAGATVMRADDPHHGAGLITADFAASMPPVAARSSRSARTTGAPAGLASGSLYDVDHGRSPCGSDGGNEPPSRELPHE